MRSWPWLFLSPGIPDSLFILPGTLVWGVLVSLVGQHVADPDDLCTFIVCITLATDLREPKLLAVSRLAARVSRLRLPWCLSQHWMCSWNALGRRLSRTVLASGLGGESPAVRDVGTGSAGHMPSEIAGVGSFDAAVRPPDPQEKSDDLGPGVHPGSVHIRVQGWHAGHMHTGSRYARVAGLNSYRDRCGPPSSTAS